MAVITVGRDCDTDSLPHAVWSSRPGDDIRISGALEIDAPVVAKHALRFVGVGLRPRLTFRGLARAAAGILTTCGDTVVQNLEFRQARAVTGNGAGIWHRNGRLDVLDCVFARNQNGLMIAAGKHDQARIIRCAFLSNGAGCGHTHGIYASQGGRLIVEGCSFEDTQVGHHLKSRAAETHVSGNYFGCSSTGTTSYAVDIANGGTAELARNLFIKGRASMSRKFIAYGPEGSSHPAGDLSIRSNIFISHRRGVCFAVVNYDVRTPAVMEGNAYEGWVASFVGRGLNRRRRPAGVAIAQGILPAGIEAQPPALGASGAPEAHLN